MLTDKPSTALIFPRLVISYDLPTMTLQWLLCQHAPTTAMAHLSSHLPLVQEVIRRPILLARTTRIRDYRHPFLTDPCTHIFQGPQQEQDTLNRVWHLPQRLALNPNTTIALVMVAATFKRRSPSLVVRKQILLSTMLPRQRRANEHPWRPCKLVLKKSYHRTSTLRYPAKPPLRSLRTRVKLPRNATLAGRTPFQCFRH